jgi:hypothetical protein
MYGEGQEQHLHMQQHGHDQSYQQHQLQQQSHQQIQQQQSGGGDADHKGTGFKVFCGGLSWDTTDEKFQQEFSRFGPLISAEIMYDRVNNRSRGFGFLVFANEEDMRRALAHSEPILIDNRRVEIRRAESREDCRRKASGEDPDCKRVFVGGLATELTEGWFCFCSIAKFLPSLSLFSVS